MNKINNNGKIIVSILITLSIFTAIVILISSCGMSNSNASPNNNSSTNVNNTPNNTTISAYQSTTHGYSITRQAIAFYDPTNPSIKISGLGTSMTDLGHVIHMFQDMTSVPHTRNDAHPPFV